MCLNRHDRQQCDLPYIPVALAEEAVASFYRQLDLSPGQRTHLVTAMKRELSVASAQTREHAEAQKARQLRLEREQVKLLDAFYGQLVDGDLFRSEQTRISQELAAIQVGESERQAARARQALVEARALDLARTLDLTETFRAAPDQVKR